MPRETSYNRSFGIQLQRAIEVSGQPSNSSIYHFDAEESLFHQKPFNSNDSITPETFFPKQPVQECSKRFNGNTSLCTRIFHQINCIVRRIPYFEEINCQIQSFGAKHPALTKKR